jgi:ribosomal protein S12 methylthiotransferase accessory factor
VTSDIGVPAFLCLAADRERGFADPEVGSGCHLDREVALLRALTEAAQARTTWIAGARDDFDPFAYSTSARNARLHSGQSWLQASETADIRDVPTLSGHSLREDVATIIARLGQAGLERVLYVDLSKRSLDIAVMRVVVPGLEGPIQQDCVRGARARRRWKDA